MICFEKFIHLETHGMLIYSCRNMVFQSWACVTLLDPRTRYRATFYVLRVISPPEIQHHPGSKPASPTMILISTAGSL